MKKPFFDRYNSKWSETLSSEERCLISQINDMCNKNMATEKIISQQPKF